MRAAVRPFALPRPDRLKGAAAEWRGRPGGPDLGGREAKSFRPKQKMRERGKEGGRRLAKIRADAAREQEGGRARASRAAFFTPTPILLHLPMQIMALASLGTTCEHFLTFKGSSIPVLTGKIG